MTSSITPSTIFISLGIIPQSYDTSPYGSKSISSRSSFANSSYFPETFAPTNALPYRWTTRNIITAHHPFLAILQKKLHLRHIASTIENVHHLLSTNRTFLRFPHHIGNSWSSVFHLAFFFISRQGVARLVELLI